MKKNKKLIFKKETIVSLSNENMSKLKGGSNPSTWTLTTITSIPGGNDNRTTNNTTGNEDPRMADVNGQ